MKKITIPTLVVCLLFGLCVPLVVAEVPKEGSGTTLIAYGGTFKAIAMGKERMHLTYEVAGAAVVEEGESILHGSSVHCIGAMHIVNGAYNDDSGFCEYTLPDGDKVFAATKASGKLGESAKGTSEYVGGTGKFAGITGSGEFERFSLKAYQQGTIQGYVKAKGDWKLP